MSAATDFDALYRRDADPWRVRTSWYERRKREVVLASLLRPRYAAAWDPACGTGDLARALVSRCDRVLASDLSDRAVELTLELVAGRPSVEAHRHALPEPPPWLSLPLELVLLAEVLYYLPAADRERTYALVDEVADDRAEVLAVHWRHDPHDGWLSGAAVTRECGTALTDRGWRAVVSHEDRDFVLASWVRGRPAADEGPDV